MIQKKVILSYFILILDNTDINYKLCKYTLLPLYFSLRYWAFTVSFTVAQHLIGSTTRYPVFYMKYSGALLYLSFLKGYPFL